MWQDMGRQTRETEKRQDTERIPFFPKPYLLFSCRSCFWDRCRALVPFLCLHVCLLLRLLAVCNFSSDHDRGATVQSAVTKRCVFMPLFSSCLCSRTGRLMLQQRSTILLACQVTGCTLCLRRDKRRTWSPLCLCSRLPCSLSLPLFVSLPLTTGFSFSSS